MWTEITRPQYERSELPWARSWSREGGKLSAILSADVGGQNRP